MMTIRQYEGDSTTVRWLQYDSTMVTIRQCDDYTRDNRVTVVVFRHRICRIVTTVLSYFTFSVKGNILYITCELDSITSICETITWPCNMFYVCTCTLFVLLKYM
jgi:hypothetical protein